MISQTTHNDERRHAIENPVNGERVIFRKTARETGGKLVECDFYMHPGGGSPLRHIHARQEERVEVISGTASYALGAVRNGQLEAGEHLVIAPGVPHRIWNQGGEDLHLVISFSPALDVEGLLEKLFALARAGATDSHGRPRLADRILLAREHEVFAAGPPVAIQRAVVRLLAPLARRNERNVRTDARRL